MRNWSTIERNLGAGGYGVVYVTELDRQRHEWVS